MWIEYKTILLFCLKWVSSQREFKKPTADENFFKESISRKFVKRCTRANRKKKQSTNLRTGGQWTLSEKSRTNYPLLQAQIHQRARIQSSYKHCKMDRLYRSILIASFIHWFPLWIVLVGASGNFSRAGTFPHSVPIKENDSNLIPIFQIGQKSKFYNMEPALSYPDVLYKINEPKISLATSTDRKEIWNNPVSKSKGNYQFIPVLYY